jgi:hypothetical protein
VLVLALDECVRIVNEDGRPSPQEERPDSEREPLDAVMRPPLGH